MSVEVECVTKRFGRQIALDGVSFSAGEGEVVGFLGPNGAGKSTLMKIATGYLPADGGRVLVCGRDVAVSDPQKLHRLIGYLPEHNPLYPDMYVREYLSMAASMHKEDKPLQRAEEMVELVGLAPEAHKLIGQLSKGYRQRVGLARALIGHPEAIILDEPTTGLDPNQIQEIRQLIRNLRGQHTVILSTHIMQEVEAVCDKVVIINRGRIMADGLRPGEFSGDGHKTLVRFAEDETPTDKLKAELPEARISVSHDGLITLQTTEDIRELVFGFAVRNNLTIIHLSLERENMESLFRRLTA